MCRAPCLESNLGKKLTRAVQGKQLQDHHEQVAAYERASEALMRELTGQVAAPEVEEISADDFDNEVADVIYHRRMFVTLGVRNVALFVNVEGSRIRNQHPTWNYEQIEDIIVTALSLELMIR